MTSKLTRLTLVLLMILGLATFACGDDARDSSTPSPTNTASSELIQLESTTSIQVSTPEIAASPVPIDYGVMGRVDARERLDLVAPLVLDSQGFVAEMPTSVVVDTAPVDLTQRVDLELRHDAFAILDFSTRPHATTHPELAAPPTADFGALTAVVRDELVLSGDVEIEVEDEPGAPDLELLANPDVRHAVNVRPRLERPDLTMTQPFPEGLVDHTPFDLPGERVPVRLHVLDPSGEVVEGASVSLHVIDFGMLEGLTNREGEVTFDVPTSPMPVTAHIHRDGLPGVTVSFTPDAASFGEASAAEIPVVLLPPTDMPHWLNAVGAAIHTGDMPTMMTVSPTTRGTRFHGFGPHFAMRFEPGQNLYLVAALWTPNAPTGVVTPDGQRLGLEGWATYAVDATKVDIEAILDFEAGIVPETATGIFMLPDWARRDRTTPLLGYVSVTSRESHGVLLAGAPLSMRRHAVVPGFAYTIEYVALKEVQQPVTVFTVFNDQLRSSARVVGYPHDGLVRVDLPEPPAMMNPTTVRFDEPLLWQMDQQTLGPDESESLTLYLRDASGALVWVGVLNPVAGSLTLTQAPSSRIDTGLHSFTFPTEAFAHDGGVNVGPWQATLVYCAWGGAFDGTCDRQAVARPTTVVPRLWIDLTTTIPFEPFPYDDYLPFYGFPTPDPINPIQQ